jgi:hypothetical protein
MTGRRVLRIIELVPITLEDVNEQLKTAPFPRSEALVTAKIILTYKGFIAATSSIRW